MNNLSELTDNSNFFVTTFIFLPYLLTIKLIILPLILSIIYNSFKFEDKLKISFKKYLKNIFKYNYQNLFSKKK